MDLHLGPTTSGLLQASPHPLNEGRPEATTLCIWLQLPDPVAQNLVLCSRLPSWISRSSVGIGKRIQKKSGRELATCFWCKIWRKNTWEIGSVCACSLHPMPTRPNFDKPQKELSQGIAKLHVALAVFSQCLQLRPEGYEL